MSTDKHLPAWTRYLAMTESSRVIGLRFKIAFTVAVALLIVTIGLAIKTSRNTINARHWVLHTHEVIECVTELGERNSSRELAMRNHIRTGNAQFREKYDAIDGDAKALGDKLVALVNDNPTQTERALRIRALMDERSRILAALLDDYTPVKSEHILAANVMPSSTMLAAMDDAMSPFREEERRLLGERQARLDGSTKIIAVLIPLIGRANAEAQDSKKLADEANKFKSAFLANVSHEIRTPLAAIIGYADILRSDNPSTPEERDEHLLTIRRSGEQVLKIVNDILDLSKIEAGRMTTENIPCCVVEVLADIASLFRRIAADRGLFFEVKYPTPIPEQIRTDPNRLRQVLMNLVGNAVKFTEQGGVRVVVDLVRENGIPPMLRIQVIDTGIGVSRDVIDTLFQPFIQADVSTTRRFGGTGLGLTISRHFAQLLGGEITLDSEVGKGSTFTLTIATGELQGVRMLAGVEEAACKNQRTVGADAVRLDGVSVLVAEDGLDNQQIILFHLRQAGAEVTLAGNGKIAVQLATDRANANHPFDLILMDMQMPVMDGYTATTTLRDGHYIGPIVALTANAMAHDREKCLTAGCNAFITKPIQWPLFWGTVCRFVSKASAVVAADVAKSVPATKQFSAAALDELSQLTAKFAAALPGRVKEIRTAFRQHDRHQMKLLAHSLAGAASSYGFPDAGQLAGQLDLNYETDDKRIADMLQALDAAVFRSLSQHAA
jgi:signal transduction histidine kinase/DNA-binding NarL/FixJ family response regulator